MCLFTRYNKVYVDWEVKLFAVDSIVVHIAWKGPSISCPNSTDGTTLHDMKEWKQLGISTKKLVVGLPLYGYMYDYVCPTLFADNTCMHAQSKQCLVWGHHVVMLPENN